MENFKKPETSIKNWAKDDRPREKMMTQGSEMLSNSELLAIIINHGSKDRSAIDLAKEILRLGHDNLDELGKLSLNDLQKIKGIGMAKAVSIAAALELGRRRSIADVLHRPKVKTSKEIATYLRQLLKDHRYEVFGVLFLNRANKIKNFRILSRGGITGVVADPKVILKQALEEEASSIILAHNHPSGNLFPSRADKVLTEKIKSAASFLDISVNDHIIVSDEGYYSFADQGLM